MSRRTSRLILLLVALGLLVLLAWSWLGRDRRAGIDAPPLLLISIDGFRHDYLDRESLPTLERLAREGLRAESLQHIFPTKTFATHYALVTGLHAENTGVVANRMWDPERRSTFSLGDREAVSDGYWYDGEPIWNTVERAGGIAATYFWPGSEARIQGRRPTIWMPYAGDTPHDERVDQVLAWLDLPADRRPDFLTLYFSVVDSVGHDHGPDDPRTAEAMREVDRALGRLVAGLERRGLLGEMHVLVTSDHGMADVSRERYVLLDDYLDLDRVRVSDWGPAAQIWAVEGGPSPDEISRSLENVHPALTVWRKGQGPERLRFDEHKRIPDVTALGDPGWMISSRDRYEDPDRELPAGMHGWDPAWRPMHGLFLAHGPRFEAGDRLPAVRAVDLHALMAELLGIAPARTDGSAVPFAGLWTSIPPVRPESLTILCGDESFGVRIVPELAALTHGESTHALPRAATDRGRLYRSNGVELWLEEDRARTVVDGRARKDCLVSEAEGVAGISG